jgi:hypothetical protein
VASRAAFQLKRRPDKKEYRLRRARSAGFVAALTQLGAATDPAFQRKRSTSPSASQKRKSVVIATSLEGRPCSPVRATASASTGAMHDSCGFRAGARRLGPAAPGFNLATRGDHECGARDKTDHSLNRDFASGTRPRGVRPSV